MASPFISVGGFLPDLPAFQNPGALEALNVIPRANSYGPLPSFAEIGTGLDDRTQGAIVARGLGGTLVQFAGDAAKLYRFNGTTLAWDDVSRLSGGSYATPADGSWQFCQFNDVVIAVNGIDPPQAFTIGTSTNFDALTGSPPTGRFCATVRDQVFLGRPTGIGNGIAWSGLRNHTLWSPSQATQADTRTFPSGGFVQAIIGGEYGTIFQERAIRRATYANLPLIWQFDEIASGIGTPCPYSVIRYEALVFFLSEDGFYVLAGSTLQPIGRNKVDRTVWNRLDQSNLHRVTSAIDPANKIAAWLIPITGGDGTPQELWLYNWPEDRWAHAEITLEQIHSAVSQSGYTLDTLDSVESSIDDLPFSLDNPFWAGAGRPQLAGFSVNNTLGFFGGPNMAATVDTTETQIIPGKRAKVRSARPIVDGGTPSIRIATRERTTDAVTFGNASPMNIYGICPLLQTGRYFRGRIEMAAGDEWQSIQGLDEIEANAAGTR